MNCRPNILVVEDDRSVRKIIKRALEMMHCVVLEAGSSTEALTLCLKHLEHVDLLLADIVLPGNFTGYELAAKLLSQHPKLKVLYTSGLDPAHFENEVRLVEGVNFLAKPYTSKQLENVIELIFSQETGSKIPNPVQLSSLQDG